MALHLHLNVVTPTSIAANNRGEGDGSTIATLQKITVGDDQMTTVSAEAIRWGLREYFQNLCPDQINRIYDVEQEVYDFKNESFDAQKYIDDDLFGYMDAKKDANNKNATTKRRGALEATRARSLDPYYGDVTFGSRGGQKGKTSIHGCEIHNTAYQYGVSLTPQALKDQSRAPLALDAIVALRHVGGNHARFLFGFHPESIVLRVTHDPAPWILNCFERKNGEVRVPELIRLIEVGDIDPKEVFVGGKVTTTPDGETLEKLGVEVTPGVKKTVELAKKALEV